MGYDLWPVYSKGDGNTIKDIETIIEKIKTNKFDKDDLIKLFNANNELLKSILEDENED